MAYKPSFSSPPLWDDICTLGPGRPHSAKLGLFFTQFGGVYLDRLLAVRDSQHDHAVRAIATIWAQGPDKAKSPDVGSSHNLDGPFFNSTVVM